MSDKDLIFNLGLINNLHEMGRKQVADFAAKRIKELEADRDNWRRQALEEDASAIHFNSDSDKKLVRQREINKNLVDENAAMLEQLKRATYCIERIREWYTDDKCAARNIIRRTWEVAQ